MEWRNRKTGELLGRELYDHELDPDETVNLAGRPEYEALLPALSSRLMATQE